MQVIPKPYPGAGLAHRLLNLFSVNDDCRLTDRQSQRWPRCRDQVTSLRRLEQLSGPLHERPRISVFRSGVTMSSAVLAQKRFCKRCGFFT